MADAPVAKTMDEIATMMADAATANRAAAAANVTLPKKVIEEVKDVPETELDDDSVSAGTDDELRNEDAGASDETGHNPDSAEPAEELDSGSDDVELQAEQDEVTQVGNDPEEFEISDDDLVEIGDKTVSLGDLKKMYGADETILTNIQAAETNQRDTSIAYAKAQEDSEKTQVAMNAMMKHVTNIISQPLVGVPNEALKTTDAALYIQQLDMYNNDQARIRNAEATLMQALTAHADNEKELVNHRKKHELHLLAESIPALKDPEKRKVASQDILDAGAHYGFSPDEINDTIDHRVYRMAHDAQQYRKLMARSGENIIDIVETAKTKVKKQTRTLRSRSTTATNRLSAKVKQQKVLRTKAQKSGKPKDVAAFMAANAKA